jgi:hypothetical protein
MRWDFPSPGSERGRPATEAVSGPDPTHRTAPALLVFHVFGKLKKHLRGRRFPSEDTLKAEIQKWRFVRQT